MKSYTHFTSPIRRYPDLIVHRLLRETLERGKRGGEEWLEIDTGTKRAIKQLAWEIFSEGEATELRRNLELIADQSSERERAADDAERELMDWRKADFMAQHLGEDFDGVITGIKDYGMYVELNEFFVEGLVHMQTLTGDVYEYNERRHRLTGKRSGQRFQLGDAVRVTVVRVDREQHLIDFALADHQQRKDKPPRKRRG
jgi:ribonuclease R